MMQAVDTIVPLGQAVAERLPAIAKRAEEIEAARHLPADIAHDLASIGIFDMVKPKSLGGLEMAPLDIVAILHAMARAEASVGWCAMIGATTAVNAAYMPHDVAKEVYGNPGTITGGVFAPMGRADDMGDHYKVSGRWQWGSGNINCHWLCGGAMIFKDDELQRLDNGAPYHRMMLFPADQVERIDTWHVMGMRGTGSGDLAVKDVMVPKARSVSLIVDTPVEQGPLYTFPVFGMLAMGVASVALGNAAGALDEIKAMAKAKKNPATGKTMAERQVTQVDIAKAEAKLGAAEAYFREAIATCWEAATSTGELSPEQRAQLRLAGAYATECAADVAKTAYTLGGGAAVYETSNLQRRFRDAHVATQHIATAHGVYELAGRISFGLPTDTGML
ncbi:acyl-CoA dehydrogenase family protein [Alterisphingorhabdus coralli]|uniref:Acyl-CoA dehydrogenase family protein n=1 Tax=Alterisphingorhabdus coralli TaxID=3071408 RepID=A0AA97F9I5_9SPHN|nr:acyl-CoA dehydrogenase family protein [Parasphingorhabdus sp. SCSIO 66989]WOE74965.1 acyl-CoA dehydrogenase family protein [Parasphingorhabdus sp. SCSIO 66989]